MAISLNEIETKKTPLEIKEQKGIKTFIPLETIRILSRHRYTHSLEYRRGSMLGSGMGRIEPETQEMEWGYDLVQGEHVWRSVRNRNNYK